MLKIMHTLILIKNLNDTNINTKIHTCINTNKDPKFQVDDHVRISKYKNIFAKSYTPNWSEERFV